MLKALIVDDEGIERRGIAALINRLSLPYETKAASNGEDALELLRQERFDVLLTDIRMPFMDGLSLTHEARRLYPELYIIIFSAYADFTNAQRAMQENVTRYLLKPVNVLEFKDVMTEVAEKIEKTRLASAHQSELEKEILRYREKEVLQQAAMFRNEKSDTQAAQESRGAEEIRPADHAVALVQDIIMREYATDLTLGDVAEQVCLTPSYLSTIFRKKTGKSFVHYLNDFRLIKAAELLRDTNRPIGDIGRDVGFSNDSYFIMLFREHYQCTPQQYRLANGNGDSP